MRPIDLWPNDSRFVEIGAVSGELAHRLVASCYSRYLIVAPDQRRRDAIAAEFPALRDRITASGSSQVVGQNNADVLILGGLSSLQIGRFRAVRHAHCVALKLQATPLCWLAILLGSIQCLLGRVAWPRIVGCGPAGRGPKLMAFRVRRPRPHLGARRFIPHSLAIEGLLRRLQSSGIRHAVLRWFENLPQLPADGDLGLLVDDASLEAVRDMLETGPGIQPVDVYSVTGLPGADFHSMPYFPPYLAEELLERTIVHRDLCRVPATREHFLSLAYHALYHQGADSGLACRGGKRRRRFGCHHDIPAALEQLGERLGIDVPITLEDLDVYLDSQGWRPPHDMLVRLSSRIPPVRSFLRQPGQELLWDDRLAVFMVREEALRRGGVDRAAQLIQEHGFQIVRIHSIGGSSATKIARSIRGGNWSRGPYPVAGGPPVAAIVAFDPAPKTLTWRQKRRFPFVANARTLCKGRLRAAFNQGFGPDQKSNVVHSSDNGREAMEYLRIIMPDAVDEVLAAIYQPLSRAA